MDAPNDDASVISMVTTEHFTLQTARSATISEATGRTGSYLSTVSGGLLALSLLASTVKTGPTLVVGGFAIGMTLLLLGLSTFQRLLQASIEDVRYGQGIARIRRYYLQRAPHLKQMFVQSEHDDLDSVVRDMGIDSGRRQMLVTSASSVAVVNSALSAALGGGGLASLGVTGGWLYGAVLLLGAVVLWSHLHYEQRFWERFSAWSTPQYPKDRGPN